MNTSINTRAESIVVVEWHYSEDAAPLRIDPDNRESYLQLPGPIIFHPHYPSMPALQYNHHTGPTCNPTVYPSLVGLPSPSTVQDVVDYIKII